MSQNYKKRVFRMRPQDCDWLNEICTEAGKDLAIALVSPSLVIHDILEFARAKGYKYNDWK
jgi:hypothetical protein